MASHHTEFVASRSGDQFAKIASISAAFVGRTARPLSMPALL
jgi:hypothetical protein